MVFGCRSARETGRYRSHSAQICLLASWSQVGCPQPHCFMDPKTDPRSAQLFDEYTRRQYTAKAPLRNPYGDEEEPKKFSEFDIFTKIKILQQLSIWTLGNADRIRSLMGEIDNDQLLWVCTRRASKTLVLTRSACGTLWLRFRRSRLLCP